MIYLRAEFHSHMCDHALDIRVQAKSKGKRRMSDILLIYILKINIFIKKKWSQSSAVGNDWSMDWVVRESDPINDKMFLFYPKSSVCLKGA